MSDSNPSLILGIDTALGGASVALSSGSELLASRTSSERNRQASHLLSWVEECLAEAEVEYAGLSGIAASIGPGGFTGIRVGLAAARSIAYAADKPIAGFSTLELFAAQAVASGEIAEKRLHVVIPAGRGKYYTQEFDGASEGMAQPLPEAIMIDEAELMSQIQAGVVVCPSEIAEAFSAHKALSVESSENAYYLTQLTQVRGFAKEVAPPAPLYIRAPDAKPQKQLLGG